MELIETGGDGGWVLVLGRRGLEEAWEEEEIRLVLGLDSMGVLEGEVLEAGNSEEVDSEGSLEGDLVGDLVVDFKGRP